MPIGSIAEIPFRARPLLELLHVDQHRDAVDVDYTGYGHARATAVVLEDGHGRRQVVDDVLLIAVHHDDDGEPLADDLELAFVIEPGAIAGDASSAAYAVPVRLSDFLRVWLPRLRGDERAIVLVACNPHRSQFAQPAAAGTTPVHYAVGDVDSWVDESPDHRVTVRLVAEAWRFAEPA